MMKNYRFLVPLLMVVLFAASLYSLMQTKAEEQAAYEASLTAARAYREQGILVDAEASYQDALERQPSLALYLEIGGFYREIGQARSAMDWGETMLERFPKQAEAYEYLMELYLERADYTACFALSDTVKKRRLTSTRIDEVLAQIEFTFTFAGEYSEVGVFSGGLCPVRSGKYWGYVTTGGARAVTARFAVAGPFASGLAPVVDAEGNAYYIDTSGNKKRALSGVSPIAELGLLENDICALFDGSTWAFYQKETKLTGDFTETSNMGNGVAAVSRDGVWSLIDRTGQDLTGRTYDGVAMDEKKVVYRNGRIFVQVDGHYEMIDASGKLIGTQHLEDVRIFNDSTWAAAKQNGKWGFLDAQGAWVIEPQYEDARSYANGFAAVKVDGLWGFLDREGELVIEPQFDGAKDFTASGTVFVKRGEVWELLKLYKYNH